MKKSTRTTVKQLAESANLDLDLTLLLLWDGGFSEVTDDSHSFSGGRLNRAKVLLGVATKNQIVSLAYWQRELSMSADEITDLLKGLNLVISPRAKTLPSGAIKKLKSYRQNRQLTPTVENFRSSHFSIEPIAPFQPFVWRVVGKERLVEPLTAEDVLAIQNALVIDFANQSEPIDPPGLRNRDLLESAIYRQHTSFNEIPKYSSVEMVAAALLHSLVFNHCFYNGNKRTALVSMLVLLDRNDITLTCDQDCLSPQFSAQKFQNGFVVLARVGHPISEGMDRPRPCQG